MIDASLASTATPTYLPCSTGLLIHQSPFFRLINPSIFSLFPPGVKRPMMNKRARHSKKRSDGASCPWQHVRLRGVAAALLWSAGWAAHSSHRNMFLLLHLRWDVLRNLRNFESEFSSLFGKDEAVPLPEFSFFFAGCKQQATRPPPALGAAPQVQMSGAAAAAG